MFTTINVVATYGLWHLRRLKQVIKKGGGLDMKPVYRLLDAGVAFKSPLDLVRRMGDPAFVDKLIRSSADASLFQDPDVKDDSQFQSLKKDLVDANMRCNYGGQDLTQLHGLVGMVSIAGGIGSKCYPVLGGNRQVPEGVLKL